MQIELKISHAITDPRVNVLVHFAWNFPQKLVPYYCLTTTEHNSMFIAVIGISLLIYLAQYLHVWGGGGGGDKHDRELATKTSIKFNMSH